MPIEDLRRITAEWLREAIALDGASPEVIAERAKVAKSTVYRLLGAEVQPEETTVAALQGVLKLPYPVLSPIKSDAATPGRPLTSRSAPSEVVRPETSSASVRESGQGSAPASLALVDDRTVGILQMIVDAVGAAVRQVIEKNELDLTRDGRQLIIAWLYQTADYFHDAGAEAGDLYNMARRLEREGRVT